MGARIWKMPRDARWRVKWESHVRRFKRRYQITERERPMDQFKPTHDITVRYADGDLEHCPVMLVDGAAYTSQEWAWCEQADWERSDDGVWTFQGRAVPDGALEVSVKARP